MLIKNLTVFSEAELNFGGGLNVFVGENGTGKTHLLKIAYSVLAASWKKAERKTHPPLQKSCCKLVWPKNW